MIVPRPAPPPQTRVIRLPEVGTASAPGWHITRRAVALSLALFVALVLAISIAAFFVTIRIAVDGDGIVEPELVTPVRPLEPGIIDRILVRTGDTVRRGQAVATLDSLSLAGNLGDLQSQRALIENELDRSRRAGPLEVTRAEAGVRAAEARVAQARTSLRQAMANFMVVGDPDSIAEATNNRVHIGLDGPAAALHASMAELSEAKAVGASAALGGADVRHKELELARIDREIEIARLRLGRHVVRAPADGAVISEQLELLGSAQVAAGQSMFEIASVDQWRATVFVSERDVYRIRVGDSADVEVPAFASFTVDRLRGRVAAVARQLANQNGQANAAAGGYRVVIAIDSVRLGDFDERSLRRGYAVHAKIIARSQTVAAAVREYIRDKSRQVAR